MSPLHDEEEVLDEGVPAIGHNHYPGTQAQQAVSDEEKEGLNTVASCHQSPNANAQNDKTESPRAIDALQHPSAESTIDATAARAKSDEMNGALSKQPSFVPENDSSALNVCNRPTLIPAEASVPREKTGPQVRDDGHDYPEGGLRAWLVILGSFSGMTASFGILNSAGTFQAYLSTHQLIDESPSAIGWIFSLYAFLTFFCGVQIGPVFDAYGPRWLVFAGTVCLFGGMMGVAESTRKCCFLLHIIPWLSAGSANCLLHRLTSPSVRTLAFHLNILRPLRYRLLPNLHPSNRCHSPFFPQTPCCYYRSRKHRR